MTMRARPAVLALLALALLPACRARSTPGQAAAPDAAPAAPTSSAIQVRAADGHVTATLRLSGPGWSAEDATGRVDVELEQNVWAARDAAGQLLARLVPGPNGQHLVDADGTLRYRVVTAGAYQLDLIGPDGVAIVRTRRDQGGAVARDKASLPVATCRAEGGRLVVAAPDGTRLATVHDTDDAQIALVLARPDLPLAERALVFAWWHAGGDAAP
jgi:hypothetical protein